MTGSTQAGQGWTAQFIDSLTPVAELALMGDIPGKFHYAETTLYLNEQGQNPIHFYFNRGNNLAWFCFYHDLVLMDFPYFTVQGLKNFRILDKIRLEEETVRCCLIKRDFKSLFHIVDPRIILHAFVRLSPLIPVGERYRLMGLVYARSSYRLEQYPHEFVAEIVAGRRHPLPIPSDRQDMVRIYYGQGPLSPVAEQATSWTLDINTAIYHATRHQHRGKIYQAQVPRKHIIGYIKRRNEKEVLLYPEQVQNIVRLELPGYEEIKPLLETTGLVKCYRHYLTLLKPGHFHRPQGIHGELHVKRVLLLLLLLAYHEKGWAELPPWLSLAALYHDIGRSNDNFDPEHGRNGYQKALSLGLLLDLGPTETEMARFVMETHCLEDEKAFRLINDYKVDDRRLLFEMYALFKDADALDRIRINDLDVTHLRTRAAHQLLLVARDLLDNPELLK